MEIVCLRSSEVKIICDVCDNPLEAEFYIQDNSISVEPCKTCLHLSRLRWTKEKPIAINLERQLAALVGQGGKGAR